jgi:hypothetical protein
MNLENNYPKWHSIVIKIPDEMITKTKSGRVSIRKTITNLGALSTSNKMKSIKIVSSNIDTPEIIDNGVITTIDKEKGPKQPKIKSTRKKKINNMDDLYNQIEKTNEELKNTKKLKTKKDHQDVINKILKEYINKKRTKKINESSTEFIKELFDYYYKNISDFDIRGNLFYKIYRTNSKKGNKEYEEKMNKNLDIFNEALIENPDIKKRIIHDYEGFKKGIFVLGNVSKIIRENKIKTVKQYYKYIDKTNDLRLKYFTDNLNKYLDYSIDPELEQESKKGKGIKRKGGNIDNEELKKFVDAGYKTKSEAENIDGYILDKELSTKRDKIYHDPKTNKTVHTIAGTDKTLDWTNNLLIPLGLHQYSNRYKNAEKIQKGINKKYGKENVSVIGHSQSGHIVNDLTNKGLVGSEAISLNPAIIGSHNKKLKVIRSSGDVVSALTLKNKKDKTINTGSYNPLYNHSSKILNKKNKKE